MVYMYDVFYFEKCVQLNAENSFISGLGKTMFIQKIIALQVFLKKIVCIFHLKCFSFNTFKSLKILIRESSY